MPKNPSNSEVRVTFHKKLFFLRWGVFGPSPDPQAGGPSLVGSPQLLYRYIHSYLPYLEALPSICYPRTLHAVVTGAYITWTELCHLLNDRVKVQVDVQVHSTGVSLLSRTGAILTATVSNNFVTAWNKNLTTDDVSPSSFVMIHHADSCHVVILFVTCVLMRMPKVQSRTVTGRPYAVTKWDLSCIEKNLNNRFLFQILVPILFLFILITD
jgi:hypothetical protein